MISPTGWSNPFRKAASRGFTLIELLFVTIMVLIVIGVSTPLFTRTYDGLRLDDVTRNVAKLMKYARERAVIERSRYRICFDLEAKRYQIEVEQDPFSGRGLFRKVEGKYGRVHVIPAGIDIAASVTEAAFYPDGSVDEATLRLSNKMGVVYTLTTMGATGDVKVCKSRK